MKLPVSAVIVRRIRNRAGIRQKEMAELFGFGVNQIYLWENGKARMRFEDLLLITEFYKLDIKKEIDGARNADNTKSA